MTPTSKPAVTPEMLPPIPAELFAAVEQMKREIELVCGVNPQVIGQIERGVRSAATYEQMLLNRRSR